MDISPVGRSLRLSPVAKGFAMSTSGEDLPGLGVYPCVRPLIGKLHTFGLHSRGASLLP